MFSRLPSICTSRARRITQFRHLLVV